MNPLVYILIRSIIESDSNKASTFVLSSDTALGAIAKSKDWRMVWPDCTITVERVMWLASIKQFSTVTIEHSELLQKAKEELETELAKEVNKEGEQS